MGGPVAGPCVCLLISRWLGAWPHAECCARHHRSPQPRAHCPLPPLPPCPDILLFAAYKWPMSKPSLMADTNDVFDQKPSNKYWVDVQVGGGQAGLLRQQ